MFSSTSILSKANPLRWSEWCEPSTLVAQLQAVKDQSRNVNVEVDDGTKLDSITIAAAIQRLQQPLPSSMTPEERRARASAAAAARLPAFKQAVVAALQEESAALATSYSTRPDGFYLRFLLFNEVFHHGGKPEAASTMLLNYCRFMQRQREAGRLTGLGAEMLRPHVRNGFVRVLGSRDLAGRRVVLSFPHDLDAKVPEARCACTCACTSTCTCT